MANGRYEEAEGFGAEDRAGPGEAAPGEGPLAGRAGLGWLAVAAVVTVVLWSLPQGKFILYPCTLLAIWFHEMAHGLAALVLGGEFLELQINANGSGVALHRGVPPGWGQAVVAAAGPLGPPVAGAVFIFAGCRRWAAQAGLLLLAIALLLSALLWVREVWAVVAVTVMSVIVLAAATLTPAWFQAFAIQFLGVQACVSTYRQWDYLMSRSVEIGGRPMLSDTAQVAANVGFLPHWFWGALIAGLSLAILVTSLREAFR